MKIALVLPYYGKSFNNYFHLFLKSCINNSAFDFHIYTDIDYCFADVCKGANNIFVHKSSLSEIKLRMEKMYKMCVALNSAYKLCDYKPMYGEIFREDLSGYDYWGYCDCDLIFGDLWSILGDAFGKYDRILSNGHLTFFRNNDYVNSYYRTQQYLDYRTVIQDDRSFGFDEWNGLSKFWLWDNKSQFDELCFDTLWVGINEFCPYMEVFGGYVGPYHNQKNEVFKYKKKNHIVYRCKKSGLYRVCLENGKIVEEPVAYVHLHRRKMELENSINDDDYLIIPNKFIPLIDLTADALKSIAPSRFNAKAIFTRFMSNLRAIHQDIKRRKDPFFSQFSWINSLMN